MKFRHEIKHSITFSDMMVLRSRLRAVCRMDEHAVNGSYEIRSLYFDDMQNTALAEKINGVARRDKFRIRLYNGDTGFIHLEKKSKFNALCAKTGAELSPDQAKRIIDGDVGWLKKSSVPLFRELYEKTEHGLRPKTIVEYTREPFIFAPGNVRVTLDYNLRTGSNRADFLKPRCPTLPVIGAPVILEVKWDDFLPDIIRDIVQTDTARTRAFSKYAACRVYG